MDTQATFKFALILGQCFGLLPFEGVGKQSEHVHFKWKSIKFLYTVICFIVFTLNALLYLFNIIKTGITFAKIVTLLFFAHGSLALVQFFQIAVNWRKLAKNFSKIDIQMSTYNDPKNLSWNMKVLSFTVMTAAALEHVLFFKFTTQSIPASVNIKEAVDLYLEHNFDYIFDNIKYNIYLGVLAELTSVYSTFIWHYTDLFLMLMSMYLSARFEQVVEKIGKSNECEIRKVQFWRKIRRDYNALNQLCKTIDKILSDIMMVSLAYNVFIILVQLFSCLTPRNSKDIIERIYFTYSFSYLIVRSVVVCEIVANVDFVGKESLETLVNIPETAYNVEIERLLLEMKHDPPSLTLKGCFRMTKSAVLYVSAAIVSYELICIQFLR